MLLLILCASISLTLAIPGNNVYSLEEGHELFETFIKEHNKQYEGKEKEERFQIFLDNLKHINSLNEKSSNAVFGISKFTDLTKDEFLQTYTGFKDNKNLIYEKNDNKVLERSNHTTPDNFDWRSKKMVSRVKDQGDCDCSWAVTVTGNVESINAIKTGSIVEISEQQLLDCEKKSGGCSGGFPDFGFRYLVKNGAMSSESYPYEAKDGSCRFDSNKVVIHVAHYHHFNIQEPEMKEKLYTIGPLSIAIDNEILQFYISGIIIEGCSPADKINQAVLLVGYGQENGVDYWIVKNSCSESWGEKGYFRMKMGVNCLFINYFGALTAVI